MSFVWPRAQNPVQIFTITSDKIKEQILTTEELEPKNILTFLVETEIKI